jgi:hypothetical protein
MKLNQFYKWGIKNIEIGTLGQRKCFRRSLFFATRNSETGSRTDMQDAALERYHPQANCKKNLVQK